MTDTLAPAIRDHFTDAPTTAPLFRHAYRAERNANGAYTIRDVEIFSTSRRIDPRTGDEQRFDRTWLITATQAMARQAEHGYRPPVHIDHHDATGTSRQHAGYLANARVRDAAILGRPRPTIIADIVEMPKAVFDAIANLRLPYRSVEIVNPREPEISSLALLATHVPFFKYPITRVQLDADGQADATFAQSPTRTLFADVDEDVADAVTPQHYHTTPLIVFSHMPTHTPTKEAAMPNTTSDDPPTSEAEPEPTKPPRDLPAELDQMRAAVAQLTSRVDGLSEQLDDLIASIDADTSDDESAITAIVDPPVTNSEASTAPITFGQFERDVARTSALVDAQIAQLHEPIVDARGREFRYQFDETALRTLAFNARDPEAFFRHVQQAGLVHPVPINRDEPSTREDNTAAIEHDADLAEMLADRTPSAVKFAAACAREYAALPRGLRSVWTKRQWVDNQLKAAGL